MIQPTNFLTCAIEKSINHWVGKCHRPSKSNEFVIHHFYKCLHLLVHAVPLVFDGERPFFECFPFYKREKGENQSVQSMGDACIQINMPFKFKSWLDWAPLYAAHDNRKDAYDGTWHGYCRRKWARAGACFLVFDGYLLCFDHSSPRHLQTRHNHILST